MTRKTSEKEINLNSMIYYESIFMQEKGKSPDRIAIDVRIEEFKGVKLKLAYMMKNDEDELVCQAGSVHCFLNEIGRPISLKREKPELYKVLIESMEKE